MAAHVRSQIRDALAGVLRNLPTTGARVFASRVYPLADADLPALLIFTDSETSATATFSGSGIQSRKLSLTVKAIAKEAAGLDNLLDQMCMECEAAATAGSLEPLARSLELTGTTIALEGTAELPTGAATMTFDCEYFTARNAPDTAL